VARKSGGKGKRNIYHPCQKPISSLERIILAHTTENDLVLEPFLGSGSTLIACLNNKRNFIGIEKEQKYIDIVKQRLKDENLS